ncbi:hypothetical protein CJ235_00320 [Staphylococcus pettenkoferi]|uniref:IrrE N-terminal-like domain-containing protein n=1 Tax=Staphylococcus pettenkoferi TaxID=170573 RepID=A0A2N6QKE4_9STAP|nr:ImmA/IrrE family metallo-endopeptidase [Staphylococcus pettenkoferi]PMC20148.1 hypothetical protein CJ235_00320 [Staphylococcus pettenkoferi]
MGEKDIRQLADEFREENRIFNMKNIVKNLEYCIESIGIKVFYSDMSAFDYPDSVSGYTRVNDNNEPEIVVNSNHVEGRRRFTMAHELGHIILHWNYPNKKLNKEDVNILYRDNSSEDTTNERETEANEFAAQLLLPLEFISNSLPKSINEYDDEEFGKLVSRVSKVFNVTRPFARRKLNKLRVDSNG